MTSYSFIASLKQIKNYIKYNDKILGRNEIWTDEEIERNWLLTN